MLPHFGTALFARLAKILAGYGDTGNDGRRVGTAEDNGVRELLGIERAGSVWRLERFHQEAPAAGAGITRLIEPQLQFDIDEASGKARSIVRVQERLQD